MLHRVGFFIFLFHLLIYCAVLNLLKPLLSVSFSSLNRIIHFPFSCLSSQLIQSLILSSHNSTIPDSFRTLSLSFYVLPRTSLSFPSKGAYPMFDWLLTTGTVFPKRSSDRRVLSDPSPGASRNARGHDANRMTRLRTTTR